MIDLFLGYQTALTDDRSTSNPAARYRLLIQYDHPAAHAELPTANFTNPIGLHNPSAYLRETILAKLVHILII